MIYLLSFLAFWLAGGFVAALIGRGVYVEHHPFSAVMFGPVALLSVSIDAFVYGWRKSAKVCDEHEARLRKAADDAGHANPYFAFTAKADSVATVADDIRARNNVGPCKTCDVSHFCDFADPKSSNCSAKYRIDTE